MKKTTISLLLCLWIGMVFGQGQQSRVTVDIKPLVADKLQFIVEDEQRTQQEIKPDANGLFVFTLNIEQGKFIRVLGVPNNEALLLYLEPGDNLQVKTSDVKNATFSGKGAENSKVLNELQAFRLKNMENLAGKTDMQTITQADYYEQSAQLFKKDLDLLEANKARISPGFYQEEKVNLKYEALYLDIMNPLNYALNTNKTIKEVLPSGYMDMLPKMGLNDELLKYPAYDQFLKTGLRMFLQTRYLTEKGELEDIMQLAPEEKFKIDVEMAKQYLSGKTRNTLLFWSLEKLIQVAANVTDYKALLDQYIADGASKEEAEQLQKLYNKAAGAGN